MKKVNFLFLTVFFILPVITFSQVYYNQTQPNPDYYASAIGINTQAYGHGALATGYYSKAIGSFTTALGIKAEAMTDVSFCIGRNVRTNISSSFAIGVGYIQSDLYLINSTANSIVMGMNSTAPTFFISESPSDVNHTDRTGKIAIGNMTDPQAKLHIYSDDNEDATLFLEASNWTTAYNPEIWFGNTNNKISADISLGMIYSTQNYHSFQDGNVGIGTFTPRAKVHVKDGDIFIEDIEHGIVMKSPDGNCWRGTLNNQGQLQFEQVNCYDLMVSAPESEAGQNDDVSIYPNPTGNRVTVEIPGVHAGAQLSIQSSAGSEIETSRLDGIRNIVDLSIYPAGVYFFRITGKDGRLMASKTVIKK